MQSELLGVQNRVQEQTQTKTTPQERSQQRPYIYELDQIRVLTILCMVAVHVLVFTAHLNSDPPGVWVQFGVLNALHFTRDVFLFITALALVYTYYGKPFSFAHFWKKRSVSVLLPYLLWTILYTTFIKAPHSSPEALFMTILGNVVTGNAYYQFYYLLLTFQFYLLLPAFLWMLQRIERHPWTVLSLSFALQLLLWTVDYFTLELHRPSSGFWSFVAQYQERFVFTYQFYFILGGVVALQLPRVRPFILAHRSWIFSSLGVTMGMLSLVFVYQITIAHASLDYIVEPLQPAIVLYSASVIAFLYWLAYRAVRNHEQQGQIKWRRFWHILSDASFGVFLVHPIVMGMAFLLVIVPLPPWMPGLVSVVLTWLLTVLGSAAWSILFMKLPILSRLVGRSQRIPDQGLLTGWLKRRAAPRPLP